MEWSADKSKELFADEPPGSLGTAPTSRSQVPLIQPWQISPRNGVRFDDCKTFFVKFAHSVTQESKKAFNPRELA
jgi:hypothetical protein